MLNWFLKMSSLLIIILSLIYLNKAEAGWSGSGYFINDSGYIATAEHVVSGATVLKVRYKGTYYVATVINKTKSGDSAIIHIPVMFTPGLALRASFVVNETVFILGYPLPQTLGTTLKIHKGYIVRKTTIDGLIPLKCWSAPGNSGGAVVDESNAVVGTLTEGEGGEDGGVDSYARPASNIIRLAGLANIKITVVERGSVRYSLSKLLDLNKDSVLFIINMTQYKEHIRRLQHEGH